MIDNLVQQRARAAALLFDSYIRENQLDVDDLSWTPQQRDEFAQLVLTAMEDWDTKIAEAS